MPAPVSKTARLLASGHRRSRNGTLGGQRSGHEDVLPGLGGLLVFRCGLARSTREVEALQYTWVSSAGGPLLIAPQSALLLWTGTDSTDGPLEGWGDYGRACAVDGYIGVVAIGEQQALK